MTTIEDASANTTQNYEQNVNDIQKLEILEAQLHEEHQIYNDLDKISEESLEEIVQWKQDYEEINQGFTKQNKGLQLSRDELGYFLSAIATEIAVKNKVDYENHISNLEQHIKKQNSSYQQSLQQTQEQYNKDIDSLQQKLNEKEGHLRELEELNAKLKKEASKYQAALGVATNIRFGDDDQNHSVKLQEDILKLQDTLENYVTNLKPKIDINIKKVQILARDYGCLSEITEKNLNKPFIKALLQRKVLEKILELYNGLPQCKDKQITLESDIKLKAQELSELIKKFSTTRVGTDQIVNVAAIKVRQQVYGILGNRGFADIIYPDRISAHDFIIYVSKEINKMMNEYRKINDINRKKEVEAMAPKLIQDIYKLFLFRLGVQEPIIQSDFFKKENNLKIDPIIMEGKWNIDEIDQLYVDVCYFPLIGRNLESSNRQIYTLAKVFPRYIRCSW